jgi:hypothetical protein
VPGLRQFAGGVACVAGVVKDHCFDLAVPLVPAQAERELEMFGGPVIAQGSCQAWPWAPVSVAVRAWAGMTGLD